MAEKEQQAQTGPGAEGDLLDQIMAETKLQPTDESYSVARTGLEAFVRQLIDRRAEAPRVNQNLVNEMIAEIDPKHAVAEMFRTLAQIATGRAEVRKHKKSGLPPLLARLARRKAD